MKLDEKKIDELLSRSVDTIYPNKDTLREKLMSGEKLRVYAGADATGASLHLGHSINYLMLKRFHELGHSVTVLIGDFTALIGDPTDKSSARVRLTKEEVQANLRDFKNQIGKILNFSDKENPIEFRFNSEWLSALSFEDVIDLSSNFTVQQMVERDMFKNRIREESPLYLHEFMYPLMQGYDSVALNVDVEVGGTDQTFNMLAGRTLARKLLNKEKFVITHPLLENPETGEILMSKSAGTGVMLNDSPDQMYGKTMALPDAGIMLVFEHCTELPLEYINDIKKSLTDGENPKMVKMKLASEIVRMYHGSEAALAAEDSFQKTFSGGEMPAEAQAVEVDEGTELTEVLLKEKLIKSKTEFRRLIDTGSIKILSHKDDIPDYEFKITKEMDIKVGKRRFIKIKIKRTKM